ncbi:MAG: beta-glucosidase [Planctomycetes bacterium]|nr:beta-glucosidase [Planctomycetota bacterium]
MTSFPQGFTWGSATSSYQIEGAFNHGGRGLSIWDVFARTQGKTHNGDHGDVACDHYHRYAEDVGLMKDMHLGAYRFSISWSRIQPLGYGEVNTEGIAFYDRLIDELLSQGIQPWVTLFHWDLPLALQLEQDGFLNPHFADYFANYADLCFKHFGDRVKNWITLNEPWCSAFLGHGNGYFAPGRISNDEPYIAAHNLLRAHGRAVDVYRQKYQGSQQGVIGITNNCDWREPLTDSQADKDAAQRALEFFLGWFADPVYKGDYPESMRRLVGDRLPQFSSEDKKLLLGSSDFFGLNHYTTMCASDASQTAINDSEVAGNGGMAEDQQVNISDDPSWEKTDMGWNVIPWGCKKLLQWIDQRYDHPPIYITENGCAMPGEDDKDIAINDTRRLEFFRGYLSACSEAIESGVDLKGYFAWSLMDNFEWALGYSMRFGIHHVDYATGERTPKSSAKWLGEVAKNNGF